MLAADQWEGLCWAAGQQASTVAVPLSTRLGVNQSAALPCLAATCAQVEFASSAVAGGPLGPGPQSVRKTVRAAWWRVCPLLSLGNLTMATAGS